MDDSNRFHRTIWPEVGVDLLKLLKFRSIKHFVSSPKARNQRRFMIDKILARISHFKLKHLAFFNLVADIVVRNLVSRIIKFNSGASLSDLLVKVLADSAIDLTKVLMS